MQIEYLVLEKVVLKCFVDAGINLLSEAVKKILFHIRVFYYKDYQVNSCI